MQGNVTKEYSMYFMNIGMFCVSKNKLNIYKFENEFLVWEVGEPLDRLDLLRRRPLDPESAQKFQHRHLDLQLGEALPDAHPGVSHPTVGILIQSLVSGVRHGGTIFINISVHL